MKKIIILSALVFAFVSCNKTTDEKKEEKTVVKNTSAVVGLKTAFVDTQKLMEENSEAKDITDKYDKIVKSKAGSLEAEMSRFRKEYQEAEQKAESMGATWAQSKAAELQKKQQVLASREKAITDEVRSLQEKGLVERDSMVSNIRNIIKKYAKENNYDYIYGTGDAASVLYGKEEYDLTKEITKLVEDEYKARKDKKN
jgi:outer membrane protein